MNTSIDKPFQNSMVFFLLVILLECAGLMLFFSGREWGLLLTIAIIAAIQALTLVLVWYTLKLSFHIGKEIITIRDHENAGAAKAAKKEEKKEEENG